MNICIKVVNKLWQGDYPGPVIRSILHKSYILDLIGYTIMIVSYSTVLWFKMVSQWTVQTASDLITGLGTDGYILNSLTIFIISVG